MSDMRLAAAAMSKKSTTSPLTLLGLGLALAAACTGEGPEIAKQRYLESGNEYFEQQRYEEAIVQYRNAIAQDNRFGEARRQMAAALFRTGNLRGGVRQQIRAADLLPDDVELQVSAAAMLLNARQYDDAEARARRALSVDPSNIDAQIVLGNALAGLQDLDGAVAQLEEAIEIDPQQARSYASLGALQAARGDTEQAEAAFEKAVAVEPENAGAQLAQANYYWASGRLDDAETSINQALELDPTNVLANRAAASLYITTNRAAEAEAPLIVLAAENPDALGPKTKLAQYYLSVNRLDDARAQLVLVADRPEGWGMATAQLARIDYAEGNEVAAHNLIDQVIFQQPNNVAAHLVKARFLIAEANYDAALEVAEAAIAADPQAANGYYTVGAIYTRQRRYLDAIDAYSQVVRRNPSATGAQLELSRLHLAAGNADVSAEFSEDVLSAAPGNPPARLALALGLMARDEMDRARSLLDELATQFPNAPEVHAQYGRYHLIRKDRRAARRSFDRALALDEGSLHALAGLVTLAIGDGDPAQATRLVEPRLTVQPENTALLLLAARAYAANGDLAAAETALRTSLTVDPSTLDAYSMLGQIYVAQGKIDEARAEFEALATRQPRTIGALTMVGILDEVQGRITDAMRRYEEVLERDPLAAVAANNLAWHYSADDSYLHRALELAQIAKAELPERHEVNDTLGWVYYRMDRPDRAIRSFEDSVRQAPDNASYHYHLGMAHYRAEDWAASEESLSRALELSDGFDGADEARRTLSEIRAGE